MRLDSGSSLFFFYLLHNNYCDVNYRTQSLTNLTYYKDTLLIL